MPLPWLWAQQSGLGPEKPDRKTYVEQNGTQTITRTLDSEHHVTSDGEVDIQRYRAPAYSGDATVQWEREMRTRKLPDGTVEREIILRNPDGGGTLTPIQVIHEKTVPGVDSTAVERETLEHMGHEELQVVQREKAVETRNENTTQIVNELLQQDPVREWKTVRRETSSMITSTVDGVNQRTVKSVVQTSDAFGRLADYETRQERAVTNKDKQLREVTVFRRDYTTTDPGHFILLDRSREQISSDAFGTTTTRHLVRESVLLLGNSRFNPYSSHPEIVEERDTVEKKGRDGGTQTVTTVRGRTVGDPTTIRPVYTVVRTADSAGYVRQVYIPSQ